jgi:hypothetical protein
VVIQAGSGGKEISAAEAAESAPVNVSSALSCKLASNHMSSQNLKWTKFGSGSKPLQSKKLPFDTDAFIAMRQ